MSRIAALYVEAGGVYFGIPDVDPWDEQRDARLYAGPWPVVAHPPCARWCRLAGFVEHQTHGKHKRGDDGGCFAAALAAVEKFGGVLEHPAHTAAWRNFNLPKPARNGWNIALHGRPGYATEIDLAAYGHPARKSTWLYAVGVELPRLDWRNVAGIVSVSDLGPGNQRARGDEWRENSRGVQLDEASRTPLAFRDVLLDMARSASPARVYV